MEVYGHMPLKNDAPGIVTIRYDQLMRGDAAWIERCANTYAAESLKSMAQWCIDYIRSHGTRKNGTYSLTDQQVMEMKGEYYRKFRYGDYNIFIKEDEKRIYIMCEAPHEVHVGRGENRQEGRDGSPAQSRAAREAGSLPQEDGKKAPQTATLRYCRQIYLL